MENDKYCNNCDWIPKSEKAIYCELCGSKLLLFSDRYCDAGCELSPSADDKFCSKCGNDLFPISKNRICDKADCDRTIPQDQLIQLFLDNYDYKNQPSEWQDNFEIPQLCIPHLFQSKYYADWFCKFDMCRNTADPGPKFASDLCLRHFTDLPKLKKCQGTVCDEFYFDPYDPIELMLDNETPRLECMTCYNDTFFKFIEEYENTNHELIALYEKHNKEPGRINGDDMRSGVFGIEFVSPHISRTLSFMKEEIYKLTDQSPPYEACIRCGKNNLPTLAEYCMVCLRSTKEYAEHWFEKVEKRRSEGGWCGTCYPESDYWVGRCGLCFDLNCQFNEDESLFPPKCRNCEMILYAGRQGAYENCPNCTKPTTAKKK